MVCYLNRGLILEQAICALLKEYFDSLHLENTYKNFHLRITNEHPFADLMFHSGASAADSFPAIVVTTQDDRKPHEFSQLPPNLEAVGIDLEDLELITKTTEAKPNKKGELKETEMPGLCTVVDEKTKEAIERAIERNGACYGWSIRTRRCDSIGIEIWAENNQLKNELYEQAREFVTGNMRFLLEEKYPFFDIAIFDNSVVGRRSNNYNFDFDVPLCGSHIGFDANYCVEQIIINTELEKMETEIITEAKNYVKN